MANSLNWLRQGLSKFSFTIRIMVIGLIIIFLHVPVAMIHEQVAQREQAKWHAYRDIAAKWGKTQTVLGPRLVIPYFEIASHSDSKTASITRVRKYASFLPESLNVNANVKCDSRYRGIFSIPVYQGKLTLKGKFKRPDFKKLGIENAIVLWNEARLLVEVTDARAIQQKIDLAWNRQNFEFKPGLSSAIKRRQGFHVVIDDLLAAKTYSFAIKFEINGSRNLSFAPFGKHNEISMTANWKDPSFQGAWLPYHREINPQGFTANWKVSDISRSYPQQWQLDTFDESILQQSVVGSDFINTVDSYSMTTRSMKYFLLFIGFTFALIWLLEMMCQLRVYVIQYVFIGLALALFYLLLTALSEHIGFGFAYSVASLMVVLTVGLYSKTVLPHKKHAWLIGGVTTLLYTYLYFLLQEAKYSFLIGSMSVFAVLVLAMYLTRRLDWGALTSHQSLPHDKNASESQALKPENG